MELSVDQVLALAPDAASAAAGRKLMAARNWEGAGRTERALWGLCRGSAVYQIRIDLVTFGYKCSCPSRKFPCKHVLGLLLLAASSPGELAAAEPPEWVADWLAKRSEKAEKQAAAAPAEGEAAEPERKPVDAKAKARRAAQREGRITAGLEQLDLFLADCIRGGLAGLEARPASFWQQQAARLVDAQAPGIAGRVSALAEIPGSGRDWPARLLAELGAVQLLSEAWRRFEELPEEMQSELRQLVGMNLTALEVTAAGETVEDVWCVVAQRIEPEDRVTVQRSWLAGRESGRRGLVLQFAPGKQPFAETIVPGTEQRGALTFYPGTSRLRARWNERRSAAVPFSEPPPGWETIEAFLEAAAELLARRPWAADCGCVLHNARLVPGEPLWHVLDAAGDALPLAGSEHWRLLALTGGEPHTLTGEWDGEKLRPLGAMIDGVFWPL